MNQNGHYQIQLPKTYPRQRILIYGAGEAGRLVLKEIRKQSKHHNYKIVGFLDDDSSKHLKRVAGVKVLGGLKYLYGKKAPAAVDEVLIAIPSAPSSIVGRIVQSCEQAGISYKILPGIYNIITGKIKLSPVREVHIEDILGRDPVKVDFTEISNFLSRKTILIAGAGGSIGSELTRQISGFPNVKLLLVDQNESNLYDLHMELLAKNGHRTNIVPLVGDIRDRSMVESLFKKYRPDIVFNAAAYKHVPLMESFPYEAVQTNVGGTLNLVRCNRKYPAKSFVFISTDKAVYPKNVMGITKRLGERLILQAASKSKTRYSVVRFGNVLGSRGSVVPLFLKQIAMGGPVTVTDPKIERYFMTIPEAAQLVLQAAANAKGGEIFILDMGERMKIHDLAKQVIRLAGFEPGRDIKIKFIGLRPGEKLTEALKTEEERMLPTKHKGIWQLAVPASPDVEKDAEGLLRIARIGKEKKLVKRLKAIAGE